MRIGTKKIRGKKYYVLEHSLRQGLLVVKEEHYLGKHVPHNIEKIKSDFFARIMKKQFYDKIDLIKKNFSKEWKRMPARAKEKFLDYFLVKFTYDSNRIEGSTITLKETAKILGQGLSPRNRPISDIKETIAHKNVFTQILNYKKDLSLQVVLKWHKRLFVDTSVDIAGKIRIHGVKVAGSKSTFPLPSELDTLLQNFFRWYNRNKEKTHPVQLAALVHLKFVSIHPFSDGNGRMSRLLMNFVLHKYGFPMLNIKYVNRDGYYNALERSQLHKDENIFVTHILRRYLKEYKEYL